MSLLDLDERLLQLAASMDLVYSPLMDVKEYPEQVEIALVEGAIANEEHVRQIHEIRERTKVLVAFGDCAVTGNVTALRNTLGKADSVLDRVYLDPALLNPQIPSQPGLVPKLLDRVLNIRACVPVDFYLPGCPPCADNIYYVLSELVAGRRPQLSSRRASLG
jgi:NAD-reducing hydrogenase small subunit